MSDPADDDSDADSNNAGIGPEYGGFRSFQVFDEIELPSHLGLLPGGFGSSFAFLIIRCAWSTSRQDHEDKYERNKEFIRCVAGSMWLNDLSVSEREEIAERLDRVIEPYLSVLLIRSLVFALPGIAVGILWFLGVPSGAPVMLYGLSLDIVGVFILAISLIRTPYGVALEIIKEETKGGQIRSLERMIIESVDGFWGTSYLFIGFIIQAISFL